MPEIRAVADQRGTFIQGTRGTVFLRITTLDGIAVDADLVSCAIYDCNNNRITSGVVGLPERADTGFYAFDWDINQNQNLGAYKVIWTYTVNNNSQEVLQEVVIAPMSTSNPPSRFAGRILEFRQSLELMLPNTQNVPVYFELARPTADKQTFMFSFNKWNQSPGCRVYLNNQIVTDGITIDYFNGKVIFDTPLTKYDVVKADYNFRWFTDNQLDRFMSNAVELVNLWPPVMPEVDIIRIPSRYIPLVLYGATVDALRNMMMSLTFPQPQMVFGGADGAAKAYQNIESQKKNYEETWNKGLEQKKNGPWAGLTKTLVTPEFAFPGGRSRWFRYLFSYAGG